MTSQRLCLALLFALAVRICDSNAQTPVNSGKAVLYLDFSDTNQNVRLQRGVKAITGKLGYALEFTTALQTAEVDLRGCYTMQRQQRSVVGSCLVALASNALSRAAFRKSRRKASACSGGWRLGSSFLGTDYFPPARPVLLRD